MNVIEIGPVKINIELVLDSAQVTIKCDSCERKKIESCDILVYTTRYKGSGVYLKNYFILKNLKFSCGSANSSVFYIRNLNDNLIEIDKHNNSKQELRNFKLKLLLAG